MPSLPKNYPFYNWVPKAVGYTDSDTAVRAYTDGQWGVYGQ